MGELDYRTRFFIKIAMVWIAILIIRYSAKGSSNDAPLDFTTFIMVGFFMSIWLAVFCAQSAFARFFFLKHPLEFSSLPELIVSIVLTIVSFAFIFFTSTVLVAPGSPFMLLFFGVFENSAEIKRQGFFLLFGITLLLFYMHLSILLYDEDIEDTASAQLISVVELVWLLGVIVNGLAGSVLNGAIAKDVFTFSAFLWSCWFVFILIPPFIMRFSLFEDSITDTRSCVLLFLVSYVFIAIAFFRFNYLPSPIVFVRSLASLGFGNRYYFLSGALFNIVFSVLLLFFLYRMHSGILGYDEDGVYDEDVELDHREQYIPRNNGEYDREVYRINSAAEWATEEGLDCGKKTESENRIIHSMGNRGENKREALSVDNEAEEVRVKLVKEKERLIQIGAAIWLLGAVINLSFFFWSLWFAFILMPPAIMRFAFFKRPTTELKDKILLFLASYLAISLLFIGAPINSIPGLVFWAGMYFLKAAPYAPPGFSLVSLGTLFSVVSALFLLSSSFYLHSAILSYGSDKEKGH